MAIVSVIYPRGTGTRFDYDYYERSHLPFVAERWSEAGLTGAEALRGIAAPGGGDPPFYAIALIRFASLDALQAAMGGPHAGEIMGDIANFTDVDPVVQVNDLIG